MVELKIFPAVASGLSAGQNPAVLFAKVGQRIRIAREKAGLSQEALAAKAGGLNKGTVNRLELGANTTMETIQRIADALGVEMLWFFDESGSDLPRHSVPVVPTGDDAAIDETDIRKGYEPDAVPVIAEGDATPDGLLWTNTVVRHAVIEYIARPHDLEDADAYGVLVIGDSMLPTFRKGHRLIVSPNTPIEDGDEVYVQLAGGERLIKIAHRTSDGWRLESLNPKYEPREVAAADVIAIHAIVWAKRKLPGRRVVDEVTGKRKG